MIFVFFLKWINFKMKFNNMKTAIILGATGLTGGMVLKKLLQDDDYNNVIIFSRRSVGVQHSKLKEHIVDLFELEKYAELFKADEVYCCVGSTKAKTPDEEIYKKVDYGIPLSAAKLCAKNDIPKLLIVSALGADPGSRFFYNRIKGEMERDVLAQKLPGTYLFQPSLIGGEREEKRFFEAAWKKFMKFGDHLLIGPLKKYRSIHPEIIADAMICVAKNGYEKSRIESDEIKEIAKKAQP